MLDRHEQEAHVKNIALSGLGRSSLKLGKIADMGLGRSDWQIGRFDWLTGRIETERAHLAIF